MEYPNIVKDLTELNAEERADYKDVYHALYEGIVKRLKESPEVKEMIYQDYVKPVLDMYGATETSIFRYSYEFFVCGVCAGIEYAEFMNKTSE